MRPRLAAALTGVILGLTLAGCGGGSSSAALVPIGAGLRGPHGLHATVYARGLPKVAGLAFDPQHRLWAVTADETDTGHDGVYLVPAAGAAPVDVVPGAHTPLGLLWHDGALYVSATGGVTAYSGLQGSAFTAQHQVLSLPAGVGEVNAIALAPDGRLWLGISAPCDHCTPSSPDSAAVLSLRPDGSDVRVEASHIRAPVGLAYAPGTSDLFVTMNQRDDLGAKTPGDWLGVVREGQSWGFPACYGQGGAACAGVPSPVAVLDAHAAVSGVAFVSGGLGGGHQSAAVAEWAVSKVLRVTLRRAGSTYTGAAAPYLTGMQHPEAVVVAPDGALLVGDWATGTVYRIAA